MSSFQWFNKCWIFLLMTVGSYCQHVWIVQHEWRTNIDDINEQHVWYKMKGQLVFNINGVVVNPPTWGSSSKWLPFYTVKHQANGTRLTRLNLHWLRDEFFLFFLSKMQLMAFEFNGQFQELAKQAVFAVQLNVYIISLSLSFKMKPRLYTWKNKRLYT